MYISIINCVYAILLKCKKWFDFVIKLFVDCFNSSIVFLFVFEFVSYIYFFEFSS
ncbi:Uncharacterised protein [Mannheimia haemolytica]|nr:Uncharacterised protein [Mannheimia haemolytica]